MELLPKPFYGTVKRYWKRRQYQRLDKAITSRKNAKIVRFKGRQRRFWKIKAAPKLRLKIVSPLKLIWTKFKNGYIDMMLNLAGNVGSLNTENTFGGKRIPKSRQVQVKYSSEELEDRLIYEIYKALIATRELSAM